MKVLHFLKRCMVALSALVSLLFHTIISLLWSVCTLAWRYKQIIWGTVYLSAIPLFAWRYASMDHGFFAPNMQLERSFSEDANNTKGPSD